MLQNSPMEAAKLRFGSLADCCSQGFGDLWLAFMKTRVRSDKGSVEWPSKLFFCRLQKLSPTSHRYQNSTTVDSLFFSETQRTPRKKYSRIALIIGLIGLTHHHSLANSFSKTAINFHRRHMLTLTKITYQPFTKRWTQSYRIRPPREPEPLRPWHFSKNIPCRHQLWTPFILWIFRQSRSLWPSRPPSDLRKHSFFCRIPLHYLQYEPPHNKQTEKQLIRQQHHLALAPLPSYQKHFAVIFGQHRTYKFLLP